MGRREVVVGVSGASGALLARRFVEVAVRAPELGRIHLIVSESALRVARNEIDPALREPSNWLDRLSAPRAGKARIALCDNRDVGASIASGSYPTSGMIVIPCSGGTLGSIANGVSRDLIGRAAEVMLKERRPLVLAFRESPYSLVAIENMRRATLAGAVVMPPTPAFYVESPSLERLLDAFCIRAGRWLGLTIPGKDYGWKGERPSRSRR